MMLISCFNVTIINIIINLSPIYIFSDNYDRYNNKIKRTSVRNRKIDVYKRYVVSGSHLMDQELV